MNGALDRVNRVIPKTDCSDGLEACEYTCKDCKHSFFQIVLYPINYTDIKLEPSDYRILNKPGLCPKCACSNLHVKHFFWGDLPKEFMNIKLQTLLDSLSAEGLYEVVQYLDGCPLRASQRYFIGEYYLKAARLGSKRAMQRLIYFYEVGLHVRKNILRAIAGAKRRYDFAGGENPQYFDFLVARYKGEESQFFKSHLKDQNA